MKRNLLFVLQKIVVGQTITLAYPWGYAHAADTLGRARGGFKPLLFLLLFFFTPAFTACNPGCFSTGTKCEPCPTGTYSENGDACTTCQTGHTGEVIFGATRCVAYKTLMTDKGPVAIMRAEKTTTPSLCVKDETGTTYYGNLSTVLAGDMMLKDASGTMYALAEEGKPVEDCGTPDHDFKMTLNGMTANSSFSFQISAQGNFKIDWGDDSTIQNINKTNTTLTTYSHSYQKAGNYTIILTGLATGYSTGVIIPAITFDNSTNKSKMVAIKGNLGMIFPKLGSPASGTTSTPRFYSTFKSCTGLTGIPENLFAGVTGTPTTNMFYETFRDCSGLKGKIPGNIFSGLNGPASSWMFGSTFQGCTGLTGIGDGLFDGITNLSEYYVFNKTFADCTNLTGPSATTKGSDGVRKPLYKEWPAAVGAQVSGCYQNATKLSDWNVITSSYPNWK